MICYLCERELLTSEKVNDDHIPPNGFFSLANPPGIKKLKTHEKCNSSFQFDEEYVIRLIAVTSAGWDDSAKAVGGKILKSITHPKGIGFSKRLISETWPAKNIFKKVPKIIENFPTTRIDVIRMGRVLTKITKGLYFEEFGKTMSSDNLAVNLNGAMHKQFGEISGSKILSIGTPGKEEFKYSREIRESAGEYQFLFFGVHYFSVPLSRMEI